MFKLIKEFLEFRKEKENINELKKSLDFLRNQNIELEFFISILSRDFIKLDLYIEKSKNIEQNILNLEYLYFKILFSSLNLISEKSYLMNEKIEIRNLIRLGLYILLRRYEPNYIEKVEEIILKIKSINILEQNIIDEVIIRNLNKEDLKNLKSTLNIREKD